MQLELKPNYRGKNITFVATREKELVQASQLATQLQTEGWQLCSIAESSQCQSEKVLFLFPERKALTPYQQTTFVRRLTVARGLKEITVITTSPAILVDAFVVLDMEGHSFQTHSEQFFASQFAGKRELYSTRVRSYADKYLDSILANPLKHGIAALENLLERIGPGYHSYELRRRIRILKENMPPAPCRAHAHLKAEQNWLANAGLY